MTVKINNSNVDFLIDTGSSINILDENTFKKIGSKPKCEFNKDILEYYGHIFSANGISADPKKISTIRNTQIPKDVGEVRSGLAMDELCGTFHSKLLHRD